MMTDHLFSLTAEQQALLTRIQSEKPTRYRLKTEAEEVYVFCAYDALLYTLLTGQPVSLEARPPEGEPFTVGLNPDGPAQTSLWHSFAEQNAPLPKVTGMPSNRCPYLHLFEGQEDAERWREGLPEALGRMIAILPLETAWQRAREQVQALASTECGCHEEPRVEPTVTDIPCACNLDTFSPEERRDHQALVKQLHARVLSIEENPDGVTLSFPDDDAFMSEVMAFVLLEWRCCPFLAFALELTRPGEQLTLRGEGNAREVIRSELGW